jgi:hypothetical protein
MATSVSSMGGCVNGKVTHKVPRTVQLKPVPVCIAAAQNINLTFPDEYAVPEPWVHPEFKCAYIGKLHVLLEQPAVLPTQPNRPVRVCN